MTLTYRVQLPAPRQLRGNNFYVRPYNIRRPPTMHTGVSPDWSTYCIGIRLYFGV